MCALDSGAFIVGPRCFPQMRSSFEAASVNMPGCEEIHGGMGLGPISGYEDVGQKPLQGTLKSCVAPSARHSCAKDSAG